MTTLEEIEIALPRLTGPELARLEALAGELRRGRVAPSTTAGELLDWMQKRAAASELLDEETLDRLDASQASPRRSSSHWADERA